MMLLPDDHDVVLSATDLTNFLACRRLTAEQLKAAHGLRGRLPRADDPHGELVRERGDQHETEHLARFSAAACRDGWCL